MVAGAFAQSYMPDQLIVKFKPGSQAVEAQVHAAAGTQIIQRNAAINWTLVRIPQGKTKAQVKAIYSTFPNYVTNVTENPVSPVTLDTTPNDPGFAQQWGPAKVFAPKMWDRSQGNTSTVVCILDTGVDIDHPDLMANLLPGDDPGEGDNNPDDEMGHGTHCAGIAGAIGNNGIGVAGMGWKNKILPVKVFGSVGGFAVATGITYAADHGANVISMSIKISDFQALRDAVDYAWGKNVLLIAAAGNDGNQLVNYPAGYDKVLAVASSDPNDGKSGFSTYGDWVDVAAPGSGIYSTLMGGLYGNNSGTSMACPMVAGLAGVLFAEGGITYTNQQVWDIICASSDKVNYVKFGRINAGRAINMIQQYKVVATPPSLATLFIGTKMTGGATQMVKNDGKVALVSSAFVAATGSTAGVILDYTPTDPIASYIDPQIHFAVRTDLPATMMVFLFNNTTQKWDFIRSTGTKATTTELLAVLPESMGKYITAQGKIKVLVRTHVPVTRGSGAASYRLQIDQAVFEGNVKI
jgi:thermitase